MTMHDVIETKLRRAVEVNPSEDALRWLDGQVARAMAKAALVDRRRIFSRRVLLQPLVLLALFALLTGAAVAGAGLLERILESSGSPGWRTAWDRAQVVDLKQTDQGVTITLERAYADLNQVLIGFTVEGVEPQVSSHGERVPVLWRGELRDPLGRNSEQWAPVGSGTSLYDPELTAEVRTWEGAVAPVAGTWVLTFTSVGYDDAFVSGECYVGNTDPACVTRPTAMIDGTWRFEFELPKPSGTVVLPDVSDTVGQATLRVTEFRVSPTMIRATIAMYVSDSPVAWWSFIPSSFFLNPVNLRHGDASYVINSGVHILDVYPFEEGPEFEWSATAGSDDAAGVWEIFIPELDYGMNNSEEIHLAGPWTLTVTVP